MGEWFVGYRSTKKSQIIIWASITIALIIFYVAFFVHFHARHRNAPYSKYTSALILLVLPILYVGVSQIKKAKREISFDETGIVISVGTDTEVVAYSEIKSIKEISTENNHGNVTLNFGVKGDLSITSNSGNNDLLSKYILPKAPTAVVEHVENASKKVVPPGTLFNC